MVAVLPDILDRSLNLLFGVWSYWHGLFHSFLFSLPLTIAALLFYRKSLLWALLLLVHPVIDIVNIDIQVLFWPLVRESGQVAWMKGIIGQVDLLHVTLNAHLSRLSTGHYLVFEVIGLGLCLAVVGMMAVCRRDQCL